MIDPCVDHSHALYFRSRSSINVNLVTPSREAACQIGYECLRSAALGFSDHRNQRRNNRHLHEAITLNARSRGGLIPSIA